MVADKPTIPAWVPIVIFGIIVLAIAGILISQLGGEPEAGSFAGNEPTADTDIPDDISEYTPPPEQNPAEYGELEDEAGDVRPNIAFSGSGERRTAAFSVNEGVLRVQMNHYGPDEYFSLIFWDTAVADLPLHERGSPAGFLGAPNNQNGPYEGVRYLGLAGGTYVIDVTGDGSWDLIIDHPSADNVVDPFVGISGSGPEGPAPLLLAEGEHDIKFRHPGEGIFRVKVYNWTGHLLPDATKCFVPDSAYGYDKTKTCRIDATGPYFFDVEASDTWSIRAIKSA